MPKLTPDLVHRYISEAKLRGHRYNVWLNEEEAERLGKEFKMTKESDKPFMAEIRKWLYTIEEK